ncbi:MAG: hydroxypyruvate isomerase [Firmicutes bacterium HGW-Firmicutes-9]|jgi:hydroxypyruvate isomerase|nr:MAG: hydroxypyruvate isomerase [Firmicutes bacterium HGW-Firmicutes-9]
MKYSLCIEPVFETLSFYDRIQAAKDLGLDAVEFWDPSVYDTKKIGDTAARAGIPVAACCLNQAWTYRMNFAYDIVRKNVEKSIAFGKDVGCSTFIGLAGDITCKTDSQKTLLIENLKRTAEICEREGVTIVLEALNSICDHKGYYLDSSYIGFEIVKAVNSPSIKLLFDCYHMQLMEGNLVNNITDNIEFIGHFHSAGVPGRHELQLGETNYPRVIRAAEEAGYTGYFGFEYWPTYDNKQSILDVLHYVKD